MPSLGSGVAIRPLSAADIDGVDALHAVAMGSPRTPDRPAFYRRRVEHLLGTDPGGAWVAVGSGGEVIGVALGLQRGDLWGLSLLAVHPRAQGGGVGGALLERALASARHGSRGIILSSADPRGWRLYACAGFRPRPTLAAAGTVDPTRLRRDDAVRLGSFEDLPLAAAVDGEVRGAARSDDLRLFMEADARLAIADGARGRGYVVWVDDLLLTPGRHGRRDSPRAPHPRAARGPGRGAFHRGDRDRSRGLGARPPPRPRLLCRTLWPGVDPPALGSERAVSAERGAVSKAALSGATAPRPCRVR